MSFAVDRFRAAFPALDSAGVYLDSAATALKPLAMITATTAYYGEQTATVNRSLHAAAQRLTRDIEIGRQRVAQLINAPDPAQIIWTKGATEAVNLIAQAYARNMLEPGDEIIVSELEHHSNLVPWLIVAEQCQAKIVKWPVNSAHELHLSDLQARLSSRTRIVAVTQMSNVTGYCPDLSAITALAHRYQAKVVVDGAQGIVHAAVDVTALDIDFYLFSAHKLYGPTGLGALYVHPDLTERLSVWHGGGKMLSHASFSGFTPQVAPDKFEAGTPNIAGQIGFAATLAWREEWDWQAAEQHACLLASHTETALSEVPGVTCYRASGSPLLSFSIDGIHPSDLALLLAEQNIAVRSGELCAQPFIQRLNHTGVVRASFAPYNHQQDVAQFVAALHSAVEILRG